MHGFVASISVVVVGWRSSCANAASVESGHQQQYLERNRLIRRQAFDIDHHNVMPASPERSQVIARLPREEEYSFSKDTHAAKAYPGDEWAFLTEDTEGLSNMTPKCKQKFHQLELDGLPKRLIKPYQFPMPNVTWHTLSSLPDHYFKHSPKEDNHVTKPAPPVLSWRGGTAPAIAYIWTACREEYMKLVRRAFERLYNSKDAFIFWIDAFNSPNLPQSLLAELKESQPAALESNVFVRSTLRRIHILGFWSQVDETLRAIRFALGLVHPAVDFIVRLSEADYPLHPASWLRGRLAQDAAKGKLEHVTCNSRLSSGTWWGWWVPPMTRLAFSCGESFGLVPGQYFPQGDISLKWASGIEWNVISRRLADYAVAEHPELVRYRELMSHRMLADEIFWSTLVESVPLFANTTTASLTYELWSGHADTSHSPTSWDDRIARENWDELRLVWEDSFLIRKIALEGSQELLGRIDDADPSPNPPNTSTKIVAPAQEPAVAAAKSENNKEETLPQAATLWTQPSFFELWWHAHRKALLLGIACSFAAAFWMLRWYLFTSKSSK